MRLLHVSVPEDFDLYLAGDDHEGSRSQYEAGLERMIDDVDTNPIGRLTHHGDFSECVTIDHPYYDPHTLKPGPNGVPTIPEEQARICGERYARIGAKFVAMLAGNHDLRASKAIDMLGHICRILKRNDIYGGYMCKIAYYSDKTGNLMFKQLAWHGRTVVQSRAGSERQRRANQEAQLQRVLAPLADDCILQSMGHTHRLLVVEPMRRLVLYDDGSEARHGHVQYGNHTGRYIEPGGRAYVNTGSFLRSQGDGYDTYAELAGLPPVELGYAVAHIRKGKISEIEERTV